MIVHRLRYIVLAVTGLVLTAGNASAHHVMGGRMPSTFTEGLLSGLGHPVIGADHLAFLVGLGIAVGIGGLSFLSPLLFLVAMACGVRGPCRCHQYPRCRTNRRSFCLGCWSDARNRPVNSR